MKALEPKSIVVGGAFVYVAVINWLYVYKIAPAFSEMGYHMESPSLGAVLFSWGLALLPALLLPTETRRPSQVLCAMMYLLLYVPSMCLPVYVVSQHTLDLYLYQVVLLLSFGLVVAATHVHAPLPALPGRWYRPSSIAVSIGTTALYLSLFASFGLSLHWIAITDVYAVRATFKDALATSSTVVSYAVTWLGFAINPWVMSIGLSRWKSALGKLLLCCAVAGQIYIYTLTGFKSVLLSIGFVVATFHVLRHSRIATSLLIWGAIGLIGSFVAVEYITGFDFLSMHLARRMFLVPGVTSAYYFEYFGSNPKAMLGYSVLADFVRYPYSVEPQYIIGAQFFSGHGQSANANVFADAFANFGYMGMLGYSLILAGLLCIVDGVSARSQLPVIGASLCMVAYAIANTALSTVVITYGLPCLVVLAWMRSSVYRRTEHEGIAR